MDEKLRDLERRAQSGDPAAASALSREVLRALEGARFEERASLARSLPALPLVLLPFGETHALVAVGESAAVPIAELPFAATSRALLEGDVVAGFVKKKGEPTRVVVRGLRSGAEIGGSPFALPEGFEPSALAIKGPALFVGGSGPRGEMLHVRDVGDKKAEWQSVEVVENTRTIHGLHVLGGRLVAVDEATYGDLLVVYDVTDPLAPVLEGASELEVHGTNERVVASSVGAGFLALLSRGERRAGLSRVVALFDLDELQERSVLSDFERRNPGRRWHDLAIVAGHAVIAAGAEGVALLDLKLAANRRLDFKTLRFAKLELAKGEHVVRLAPVPDRGEVVAAIGAASGSPVTRLAVLAVS